MAERTKIEWCDSTFNPWTGCTGISPGCARCYAEAWSKRAGDKVGKWGPGAPRVRTSPAMWRQPVRWNAQAFVQCDKIGCGWRGEKWDSESCWGCDGDACKPARRRVFCASLADVFDNEVPPEWRRDLFDLIRATPNLDWLLLTKRIGNAARMIAEAQGDTQPISKWAAWPLSNVWLGATIVNQEEADRDIPKLLATPAAVRFVSMEPLLGPVDLPGLVYYGTEQSGGIVPLRSKGYPQLDWVIAGGESGHGARPSHPDWFRSLRDQCEAAGVPFLFKQWGEWRPISQMQDSEHTALYRSRRRATEGEDQNVLDECYGRECTVSTGVVHTDGSLHAITEPMAFLQGKGAMQAFKVGKKAAGRYLDDAFYNGFPRGAA